ncbi:MAG: hypothetical protein EOO41_05395, partial [Methanobacteriota archaeon]
MTAAYSMPANMWCNNGMYFDCPSPPCAPLDRVQVALAPHALLPSREAHQGVCGDPNTSVHADVVLQAWPSASRVRLLQLFGADVGGARTLAADAASPALLLCSNNTAPHVARACTIVPV